VCVSLDEPKPVDSVLTFLSGYDTLEYSSVKATAVSVRLRILFATLQSTNTLRSQGGPCAAAAGSYTARRWQPLPGQGAEHVRRSRCSNIRREQNVEVAR